MQSQQQLIWRLPDGIATADVMTGLEKKFRLEQSPATTSERTYYDTFDWRLFKQSMMMMKEGQNWRLVGMIDDEKATCRAEMKKNYRFWWDFPSSSMRDILAGPISVRALLPVASLKITAQPLRIVNKDKKTVGYVDLLEQNNEKGTNLFRSVSLREVRGYGKPFTKLTEFFNQYGEAKPVNGGNEFRAALKAMGVRTPLDYTSKFRVSLNAGMSARQAVKTIYKDLLATMLRNRQGILDDIDSEFLHDFRVAVRRTRSAMSLIKNVLEPEVVEHFQEEFRYLGQVTGPTRDLDVYLLMEDNYKARLSERLQTGLHYFFEELAQRRRQEQKRLARALRGRRYKQIVTDWQEYLDRDDRENPTKKSDTPVEQIARKIILKRCLRVVRDGRAIHQDSPDNELHRLRIQGKKLRYSLEFFSSLFPEKKMKKLINQLKLLQDNLGDFNDLSVQQDMLREYLADIKPRTIKSKELAAALGGLLTNLYHQHRRVRTHFEETFTHFASKKNLAVYQQLFG